MKAYFAFVTYVYSVATVSFFDIGLTSLVPRLPDVLNVARRERREPGKFCHVRDVGVEATWSAVCTNPDSALSER